MPEIIRPYEYEITQNRVDDLPEHVNARCTLPVEIASGASVAEMVRALAAGFQGIADGMGRFSASLQDFRINQSVDLTGSLKSVMIPSVGTFRQQDESGRKADMPRRRNPQLCNCGCGNMTNSGQFLRGHATRLRWKLIKAAEANETIIHPMSGTVVPVEGVKNWLNNRKWTIPVSRRAFGIEFELTSPIHANELETLLVAAKIKVRNRQVYGSSINRLAWEIKSDSSIHARNGRRGYEIVSPILRGKKGEAEVRRVLKVLNDAGCAVNQSTGTHVHIQAADLNVDGVRNVALTYDTAGTAIDMLFAPSRRGYQNRYCQPLSFSERERIATAYRLSDIGGNKYRKINVATYPRLGTLEFRQHQGTLNADKILSWLNFARKLVQTAGKVVDLHRAIEAPINNHETTLRSLFNVVSLDAEPTRLLMNRYYQNRAA